MGPMWQKGSMGPIREKGQWAPSHKKVCCAIRQKGRIGPIWQKLRWTHGPGLWTQMIGPTKAWTPQSGPKVGLICMHTRSYKFKLCCRCEICSISGAPWVPCGPMRCKFILNVGWPVRNQSVTAVCLPLFFERFLVLRCSHPLSGLLFILSIHP